MHTLDVLFPVTAVDCLSRVTHGQDQYTRVSSDNTSSGSDWLCLSVWLYGSDAWIRTNPLIARLEPKLALEPNNASRHRLNYLHDSGCGKVSLDMSSYIYVDHSRQNTHGIHMTCDMYPTHYG